MDVPVLAFRASAVGRHARRRGRPVRREVFRRGRRAGHQLVTRRVAALERSRRAAPPPGGVCAGRGRGDAAAPRGVAVSRKPQVAIVVQRYGAEIAGGSESLARAVAERLASDHEVTVLTTLRARLRELEERAARREHGARTASKSCVFPSSTSAISPRSTALSDEPVRPHTQRGRGAATGSGARGPTCHDSFERLEAERDRYSAVLFFTYLYFPTYWGLRAAPERSILVPTAHDEPPLRSLRSIVASSRLRGPSCSAPPPERELVRRRFEIGARPEAVAGIGVEAARALPTSRASASATTCAARTRSMPAASTPARAATRCSSSYDRYRASVPRRRRAAADRQARDAGAALPGVRYLGYLSEAEKLAAMAGAQRRRLPEPLREPVDRAARGAWPRHAGARQRALAGARGPLPPLERRPASTRTRDEFVEALDLLVTQPRAGAGARRERPTLCGGGYRWDVVMGKYREP